MFVVPPFEHAFPFPAWAPLLEGKEATPALLYGPVPRRIEYVSGLIMCPIQLLTELILGKRRLKIVTPERTITIHHQPSDRTFQSHPCSDL